jgi:hypothetical protein
MVNGNNLSASPQGGWSLILCYAVFFAMGTFSPPYGPGLVQRTMHILGVLQPRGSRIFKLRIGLIQISLSNTTPA